jgi:hypothetical protein
VWFQWILSFNGDRQKRDGPAREHAPRHRCAVQCPSTRGMAWSSLTAAPSADCLLCSVLGARSRRRRTPAGSTSINLALQSSPPSTETTRLLFVLARARPTCRPPSASTSSGRRHHRAMLTSSSSCSFSFLSVSNWVYELLFFLGHQ